MAIITFISLLISLDLCAQSIPPLAENEILILQEYRELKKDLTLKQDQIQNLESNECLIKNDHYNECSKPFLLMEELLEKTYNIQEQILDYQTQIYPYLDSSGNLLETIEMSLEERFPLSIICPQETLIDLIEKADSMLIFVQRLRKLGLQEDIPRIPNAKKRDCDEKIKNDCWELDPYGNVFYITKENLKIHYNCLFPGNKKVSRDIYNPESIISSSNAAVKQLNTCFAKLNPSRSKEITDRIQKQEYMMFCKDEVEDFKSSRCGFAKKGGSFFNLVKREVGCENLDETIFHEILHLNSHIDNLETEKHNDSLCSKHDAVYFCSTTCFPRSRENKIKFSQKACRSCVKNPNEAYRCDDKNFDNTVFDQSYFNCE